MVITKRVSCFLASHSLGGADPSTRRLPHPPSFSPQAKTVHPDRLLENFSVWDFELSPDEMAAIDGMDLTQDPRFKDQRISLEWNPVDCP
jgi:hypothetical protein